MSHQSSVKTASITWLTPKPENIDEDKKEEQEEKEPLGEPSY